MTAKGRAKAFSHNRRFYYKFIALPLLALFVAFSAGPAIATVDSSFDWHLVGGQPKRTLHYCFEPGSVPSTPPSPWIGWVREAAQNWNNAGTGWTFEEQASYPCQVNIRLADISESTTGGAMTSGFHQGRVNSLTITFDSNLENSAGWRHPGTPGDNYRDPVGVAKHELSHALRIDHNPDYDPSAATDPDIADPRKAGDHNTTLSEHDRQEARDAATSTIAMLQEPVGPQGGLLAYAGHRLQLPPGAVQDFAAVGIRPLSLKDIPAPLAVPSLRGQEGVIVSAVDVYSQATLFSQPITVTLSYDDSRLSGGFIVGELHEYVVPPIDESRLGVYYFSEEGGNWQPLAPVAVDVESNTVAFRTTSPRLFGIGGPAVAGVPASRGLSSVAGQLTIVLSYDAFDTADPWKLYEPSAPPFASDLAVLEAGRGYWAFVKEKTTFTYGVQSYPLNQGWNLIGWQGPCR